MSRALTGGNLVSVQHPHEFQYFVAVGAQVAYAVAAVAYAVSRVSDFVLCRSFFRNNYPHFFILHTDQPQNLPAVLFLYSISQFAADFSKKTVKNTAKAQFLANH